MLDDKIRQMCNCFSTEAQEINAFHRTGCPIMLGREPSYSTYFAAARGAISWQHLRLLIDIVLINLDVNEKYVNGAVIHEVLHYSDNQKIINNMLIGRQMPDCYNLYYDLVLKSFRNLQSSEKVQFLMV